jgi:hypothetical protein
MIYGSPHSYRGLVAGRSLSHSPLAANEVGGSSESPCLIEVVHIHHDEDGVRINLSGRIAADQPRLRADMVTALLLGIGVLRVLLNKEPIATATDRDIATIFNEAFHSLTRLPRGSNESAAS